MNTNILGTGLSAVCVLPRKIKCKDKIDLQNMEYVSKIVEYPDSDFMKQIYLAEIYVSTVLKQRAINDKGKEWFYNRFSPIDAICDFDLESNLNDKDLIQKCNLDQNKRYTIFFSVNGGCSKLKIGDNVNFISDDQYLTGIISFIDNKTYTINVDNKAYSNISQKNIIRYCGTLAEKKAILEHFSIRQDLVNRIKYLLVSLKYLHDIGIAHNDIKPNNLVINSEGIIRIIDFGSGIYFNNDREDIITQICNKYDLRDKNLVTELYLRVSAFTPGFVSPEFILASLLLNIKSTGSEDIMNIYEKIQEYAGLNLSDDDMNYINNLVDNKEIFIKNMFCFKSESQTPLMLKNDIYAMGKTLFFFTNVLEDYDNRLLDLISKMTNVNIDTRYDIDQCLSHAFFR